MKRPAMVSGTLLLSLLFAIVVFGPLAALIVAAGGDAGSDALLLLVPAGRRLSLFCESILLSGAVAATATLVGLCAASLLWEMRTGPGSRARWLLLVAAPVPAYLYAQAWMGVAGSSAPIPLWVPADAILSAWVQIGAFLPLCVGLSMLALASVPPPALEAARTVYPDIAVFRHVVLPLAAPALAACTALVFVLSVTDYSVPTLFSLNVYSLEIFAEFSATNDPARALFCAAPLLAVTIAVLFLAQGRVRDLLGGTGLCQRAPLPPVYPRWFVCLQTLACGIVLLHLAVLVVSLVLAAGLPAAVAGTVATAGPDIGTTFSTAVLAALCALPPAYGVAARMNGKNGRLLWLLCLAPLAIPSPLVGIGLIALCNTPAFPFLYGTAAMPVLASVARFAPFAALVIHAQLQHTDTLLIDAVRVFQSDPLAGWLRVRVPLIAPGLLAAGGIVFALSAGELGATLLVIPPGMETVTIRLYNYLHYGSSAAVAGLGLVMMAMMAAAGAAVAAGIARLGCRGGYAGVGRR
ncbi:MAG: iron ABC transporter permease [Methanomicrobiales archaeon]|nr:iron ABC transporter permease [Methanomicrobiales archaeon]